MLSLCQQTKIHFRVALEDTSDRGAQPVTTNIFYIYNLLADRLTCNEKIEGGAVILKEDTTDLLKGVDNSRVCRLCVTQISVIVVGSKCPFDVL